MRSSRPESPSVARQVGEVLHGFLGAPRIGAREGRYGIHAVEQKMRSDTRLQRVDARPGLGPYVQAPLVRDEKIAQQHGSHDQRDAEVAQQKRPEGR